MDCEQARRRCEQARRRIEQVALEDWDGLPDGCRPETFGAPAETEQWALRPLGEEFERAHFRVLEIAGYYRPTISVRDGAVVLFDGMNPAFEGDPAAFGSPGERLDYAHGTLPVPAGEWVYAERGITLFVNTTADTLLHVALYAPTSVPEYRARLRPHLGKTLRPRAARPPVGWPTTAGSSRSATRCSPARSISRSTRLGRACR